MKLKGKFAVLALATALTYSSIGKMANPQTHSNFRCGAEETQSALNVKAKAAFVMESNTKTPVYSHNEMKRLPIASMCKIMTLLLAFESIERGVTTMDEEITVSENAASMGGSQVFLEAHAKYPVRELIKSIVVCSANDSCVAMAEKIAGSEQLFVEKMNARAKELGAENTLFANCTGLPKEPQYSCAKDVAVMLNALIKHEEYFAFGKIWMDKFQHPEGRYTEISNTNRLVRFYDGCDGGKTGFTSQAGFCLAATAKRGNMRVISVVIGEENSKQRFDDVRTTFDYAFANYELKTVIDCAAPLEKTVEAVGGKQKRVAVAPVRNVYAFVQRGTLPVIQVETNVTTSVKAPVEKGAEVGEIVVYKDGVETDRIAVVTMEESGCAGIFDKFRDVSDMWNLS